MTAARRAHAVRETGPAAKSVHLSKTPSLRSLLAQLRRGNLDQICHVEEGVVDLAKSITEPTVKVYTKNGEILVSKETLVKLATSPQDVLLYDLGKTKVWYSNLTSADFHNFTTPDVIRTQLRMAVDGLRNGEHVEIDEALAVAYLKHCIDMDIEYGVIPLHGDVPNSKMSLGEMVFGCRTSPQSRYAIAVKDGEGFRVEFWKRQLPWNAR